MTCGRIVSSNGFKTSTGTQNKKLQHIIYLHIVLRI